MPHLGEPHIFRADAPSWGLPGTSGELSMEEIGIRDPRIQYDMWGAPVPPFPPSINNNFGFGSAVAPGVGRSLIQESMGLGPRNSWYSNPYSLGTSGFRNLIAQQLAQLYNPFSQWNRGGWSPGG